MKNHAKVSKSTALGVLGLTAAGIAATIALANGTAAETSDSSVEGQQSAPVHNYSGPRSADAAEGWLKRKTENLEQKTPDASKVWIEPGIEYTGPRTADAAEHWFAALRED